jgi:hypothetical protein
MKEVLFSNLVSVFRIFGATMSMPNESKEKIIRLLINEIMVDINEAKQTLHFIIHWQGGRHTELSMPRPLPANKAHKTAEDDLEIIRKMAVRYDDSEIAKVLGIAYLSPISLKKQATKLTGQSS